MDAIAARQLVMRQVSAVCRLHGLRWALTGDFVRHLASGRVAFVAKTKLQVSLSPAKHDRYNIADLSRLLNTVCHDLEAICDVQFATVCLAYNWAEVECVFNGADGTAACISLSNDMVPPSMIAQFDTDMLVITDKGMSVVNRHAHIDRTNSNPGLAVLDRLGALCTGRLTTLTTFVNDSHCALSRARMASCLGRELAVEEEGFEVEGLRVRKLSEPPESCPICLCRRGATQTTLKCGHSFCVQCLCTQMAGNEEYSGLCPLCRAAIELVQEGNAVVQYPTIA
jgi:hypothetical protein